MQCLGVALLALDRVNEAEAEFRTALAAMPDYANAHVNLGTALYRLGRRSNPKPPAVPLVDLLKTVPGAAEVVPASGPLPQFDFWLPLLSVSRKLNSDLASIPAAIPYLRADPEAVTDGPRVWRNCPDSRLAWPGRVAANFA